MPWNDKRQRKDPNKDEWGTPLDLFRRLDNEFHFTLDPAATDKHHLCDKYYTIETDGLKQSWEGERVFCNAPYSGNQISKWIEKANIERNRSEVIVFLIPVTTDTKYFHSYILPLAEIRFIKGRLKFIPLDNQPNNGGSTFASMIVVWRRDILPDPKFKSLDMYVVIQEQRR